EKIYLFREDYSASDGKEIFLSFENKNRTKLYSLLRLRISSENKAIIREIHTYGQLHPIGESPTSLLISPQHKGLGKRLIKEAEKITGKEYNLKNISVIAGIGARDYFRKSGYKLKDTYMVKNVRKAS
ncbi:MAG: tRNA uridine(34) 5-carboxymethylaminomethyl modification radical SAM/GNAT enzyme Elp3, partial [Candidatus Nealsonbacteria bacterium CG_4_10_14_0_2_um_filter_40_15]